ncbi:hypothetical protein [Limnohabitans sp. Jir72]|uniref:hypothetical protein n=1 Tax=Limnohabitans sp. Jir72 TaxID=1977909 RepID=UPI0011B23B86|nr:hypothetical protein [Limnohabitans sp. Jir72]
MNQDKLSNFEIEKTLKEISEYWGLVVSSPNSWKAQFECEFNGEKVICNVLPLSLTFGSDIPTDNNFFVFSNNQKVDFDGKDGYVIDYRGESCVMRVLRAIDRDNGVDYIYLMKNSFSGEMLSWQLIRPDIRNS